MINSFSPDYILSSVSMAFFDFDNTITSFDVLDDIIEKFCRNNEWRRFEILWQKGEIGSAECLRSQLRMIRASGEQLSEYLSGVKVDPYFKKLLLLFQKSGIETAILSDSFHFFIESILRNNGLGSMKIDIYANELEFTPSGLKTSFPHSSAVCGMCGHCKKETIISCRGGGKVIFAGDGRSDFCAAQESDFIFAKEDLAERLRQKNIPFFPFSSLADIYNYFVPFYKELRI